MKKILFILTVTLLTTLSYSQNELEKSTEKLTKQKDVNSYEKILSGNHSNINKRTLSIIKSSKELENIYETLNKAEKSNYEIPKIDFSKEVVIALFMGEKKSDGNTIQIEHIQSDAKFTAVFIKETKSTEKLTSVTTPFYIAKMPKPDKPIRLITFL